MDVAEILRRSNQASLDSLVPLIKIQTRTDMKRYAQNGYSVGITAKEFSEKYPLLSIENADVTFIPYSPFGSLQIFSADNIRPCRTLPLAHTQQQSRRRTKQLPQQAEWKRIARNS